MLSTPWTWEYCSKPKQAVSEQYLKPGVLLASANALIALFKSTYKLLMMQLKWKRTLKVLMWRCWSILFLGFSVVPACLLLKDGVKCSEKHQVCTSTGSCWSSCWIMNRIHIIIMTHSTTAVKLQSPLSQMLSLRCDRSELAYIVLLAPKNLQ